MSTKANPKRDAFGINDYWRARGDRAIARRLWSTYLILDARRERLRLCRSTICVLADLPQKSGERVRRLGARVARYYHAEGELARCAARLGKQLGRWKGCEAAVDVEPPRASNAGRVLTFSKRHVDADDRAVTWARVDRDSAADQR